MNISKNNADAETENKLFPLFVKLERLRLLLVGGGKVGLEKLQAVLQNSPATAVTVVGPVISELIRELAASHPAGVLFERPYQSRGLEYADPVILAVHDRAVSEGCARGTRAAGILGKGAD